MFLDNVVPDLDEAGAIEFTSEGVFIFKYLRKFNRSIFIYQFRNFTYLVCIFYYFSLIHHHNIFNNLEI